MKRIILFSEPQNIIDKIEKFIFPSEIQNKKLAYMPANSVIKQIYFDYWKEIADRNNTEIVYINNNSENIEEEKEKLNSCNILLVTGGKITLLNEYLRKSGLDKTILDFLKRDSFIYAGFSAGAMILTPSIKLGDFGKWKENLIDFQNLNGLHVIDYEILPHYVAEDDEAELEKYRKTTSNEIKTLKDDEYILIEK